MKPRLLISVDVETLGTTPGLHPMISYGAAAIRIEDAKIISRITSNLKVEVDQMVEESTWDWWHETDNAAAWQATTIRSVDPAAAMAFLFGWIAQAAEEYEVEFLAKPVAFDRAFIEYGFGRYIGSSPFPKWRGWDLHTLMSAITGIPINQVRTKDLPGFIQRFAEPFRGMKHTALDDATYQGMLAIACFQEIDRMAIASQWTGKVQGIDNALSLVSAVCAKTPQSDAEEALLILADEYNAELLCSEGCDCHGAVNELEDDMQNIFDGLENLIPALESIDARVSALEQLVLGLIHKPEAAGKPKCKRQPVKGEAA